MNDKINISAIDRALAAAKARKAAKEGTSNPAPMPRKAEKTAPKADPAEKAAEKQRKDEAKAARKAERDAARTERKAAKAAEKASKKPAHMKKVERALSKLPSLNEPTQLIFNEATCNLSAQQLDALAQHILHHNRTMATTNAMKSDMLRIGDTVRITGGDPKFVGMVGTVVKSRQLRAKIQVPGFDKLVYIFTGQAEPVAQATAAVG
ncbi:MAG: hypothetical protein EBR40_03180 [Proteobacteria bacterium]|nr:hypothetical protein [Pseudomonadota bacterium]